MKLDLKQLCRCLAQMENGPTAGENVNPYLLDRVFTPAIHGFGVPLASIDWDAFEEDDIEILADYYDRLIDAERKVIGFAADLSRIVPVAGASRAFC